MRSRACLLLLAALACLGWLGDPAGLQVRPWLQKAGVRFVAAVFVPKDCPNCAPALERWRRMKKRYGPDGLRVVVVAEAGEEACAKPSWADHHVCGASKVFSGFRVPKHRASAAVWDWRGPVVAKGSASAARRALRAEPARVGLSLRGDDAQRLAPHLRRALRGTGKLTPDPARVRPGPARPDCALGHVASDRLLMHVSVSRGVARATVEDTMSQCRAAEAQVSLAARSAADATAELVGRLVFDLQAEPGNLDLGAAPEAPSPGGGGARHHTRPGVLIDPGGPPAAPIEAAGLGQRRTRARPGALVGPGAGAGTDMWSFAQQWVGTRHAEDGDGRDGIDGPHLIRRLYEAVYGMDLTSDLAKQLRSGPEVPFDPGNGVNHLQPGDLIFSVTYAYLPRAVSVYLGNGKVLTSVVIRGVVIDDAPKSVPEYLYLVVRRPLAGPPPR